MQENLDLKQAEIVELIVEEEEGRRKVTGVKTHTGTIYKGRAVIIDHRTYLKAKIIIGDVSYSSGPDGLFPADKLSDNFKRTGDKIIKI